MKKWAKVVLWFIGVTSVIGVGLILIGMQMHNKSENFVRTEGNFTNVRTLMSSDKVLCSGSATGMIVAEYDSEKPSYYPVCSPLFGEATVGKWQD